MLGFLHFFCVCIFDLFLETFVDLFTGLEPICEDVNNFLDVFGLYIAGNSVVDLKLTILLVEFAID